jgi:hypothetical protein
VPIVIMTNWLAPTATPCAASLTTGAMNLPALLNAGPAVCASRSLVFCCLHIGSNAADDAAGDAEERSAVGSPGAASGQERLVAGRTWLTNQLRAVTHGRALRGQRLVARVPHGLWTTMTLIAALRSDRIDAPCVLDGPINGRIFLACVVQFLIPTLRPGDIVVLDNLGSHKSAAVRNAIRTVTRALDPTKSPLSPRGHVASGWKGRNPAARCRFLSAKSDFYANRQPWG